MLSSTAAANACGLVALNAALLRLGAETARPSAKEQLNMSSKCSSRFDDSRCLVNRSAGLSVPNTFHNSNSLRRSLCWSHRL